MLRAGTEIVKPPLPTLPTLLTSFDITRAF